MKRLKTKERSGSWLPFAITSVVVVVLALGLSQMLPEPHPIRALRKVSEQSASNAQTC